jgi:hypothetical protein
MMRARRARAVLALAVATLLVPKAIASDVSSASEGDRTALVVAGLGGAAAVALGAAATTGSGVGLTDRLRGLSSSVRRTDAAFDAIYPKEVTRLSPKAYLALDSRDGSTTQVLRYLSGLGGDDLAQNRLISAKRGAPLVNLLWSRTIWCEEEQEFCSEKNRDSGIWRPRAFSSSATNTCNKARMLCAACESWLADENGKPLSPERFKLLEAMVDHEYIGEDKSLVPYASLGAKVAGVGGGLGQCINKIVGARLHDLHAIDATSTRPRGGVVSYRPIRLARPSDSVSTAACSPRNDLVHPTHLVDLRTGFGPHDAMLVEILHAFAHEETRVLIDWDGTFCAGCFYGEEVLVALVEGLISFDEAGHAVNLQAIPQVGEQMAVATHIFTHQVRDVVTYAQITDGARLAVRFMAMTGFDDRQTSPWFVLTTSDAWAADGALQYGHLSIPSIERAQKTSEYVLGLVADTFYSNAGAIVGLEDGVAENPDHLGSVMSIVATIFNSKRDFVHSIQMHSIQNGECKHLRVHPREMTPREVAAAARMGVTPSDDNVWPDWLLRTLRRERPGFMRSGGYEQLKMWPYWLIWIEIDCLSLWSGMVYEMVALDSQGRVVERARPEPYVHDDDDKTHFLEWGAAPQTIADLGSFVDLDDEANRPTFLSADELREELDKGKSPSQKRAEGIGGVCNKHLDGHPCDRGDACPYKFHYGHENLGTFYKVADKCHKHTDGLLYCKVCGATWDMRKHHCSEEETCAGGTWGKYHAIREQCDAEKKPYPDCWKSGYVPEGGVQIAPPKVDAAPACVEIKLSHLRSMRRLLDSVAVRVLTGRFAHRSLLHRNS